MERSLLLFLFFLLLKNFMVFSFSFNVPHIEAMMAMTISFIYISYAASHFNKLIKIKCFSASIRCVKEMDCSQEFSFYYSGRWKAKYLITFNIHSEQQATVDYLFDTKTPFLEGVGFSSLRISHIQQVN